VKADLRRAGPRGELHIRVVDAGGVVDDSDEHHAVTSGTGTPSLSSWIPKGSRFDAPPGGHMPTLSIHFDPAVIAHLTSASGDDTVHVTLSLGASGSAPTSVPAPSVPRGPLAGLMQAGLLTPGAFLVFHKRRANRSGRAVVTADGHET
jgi:hypothetical protein